AKNLAVNHLSRLENPNLGTFAKEDIADKFPDEHIMILKTKFNEDEPCIFKDAKDYVMRYDTCQRSGNISSRSELPQNNIQKAITRFGVPKALISDWGIRFCNSQLEKALQKYEVTHKLSIAYNPQTNGQTEVTNRAIKCILERSVYGKAYHLPVEIEHKGYWALKQYNIDLTTTGKNHFMELNELIELRDGAYENTQIYKERTKKWHDSRLRGDKNFKVGEKDLDASKEIDNVGRESMIWKSGSVGVLKLQDGCSKQILAHKLNMENLPRKISREFL
ncbi:reverse transcriptase domain-containing protein, partial [Tanacetum coccineum]